MAVHRRFRDRARARLPMRHGEKTESYERRVAVETERLLKMSGWYIVRSVNEPLPGWSVAEDIREEQLAITYGAIARIYA